MRYGATWRAACRSTTTWSSSRGTPKSRSSGPPDGATVNDVGGRTMRTRLGLAPALLIVGLAAALVLHMSQSRAGSVANPAPTRAVGGVAITVAVLQFPAGRGDARWQRPSESVYLGIDHTGIVVESTERSLAFYRDALGLQVVAASQDPAPAPERSTGAPGGRRRITTIRASEGPEIELVQYLGPGDGRRDPPNTPSTDRARWQTLLVAADADAAAAKLGIRRGLTAVDPDGHEVQLRARK